MSFLFKIIGALCSGVLLYWAFDTTEFMWLSVVSFIILICVLKNITRVILRCILLTIFILTFVVLQFSFLFKTADLIDNSVLLLNLIITLIYLVPIYAVSFIKSKYYIEITLLGFLISEYIFATISIGNQLFQLGIILCNIPFIVQWYEFTGIFAGSFWIILISYFLYRSLFYKKYFLVLIGIIVIPIIISLIIGKQYGDFHNNRKVIFTSLTNNNDADSMINGLISQNTEKIDYILMPEGALTFRNQVFKFSPTLTKLRRFVKKNGNICFIIGIYTNIEESYDNSVLIFSKDKMRQRYKILKIPFCEYLPYPHILSKIDFINEHVWYKMDEKKNESDLYIHSQDTIAPLICYESLSSKYVCDLTQQGANIFFVSSSNSFIDSNHIEQINTKILRANAIITRKMFVRSVEHGISCIITPKGDFELVSKNQSVSVLKIANLNYYKPFYAKHFLVINKIYLFALLIFITLLGIYGSQK